MRKKHPIIYYNASMVYLLICLWLLPANQNQRLVYEHRLTLYYKSEREALQIASDQFSVPSNNITTKSCKQIYELQLALKGQIIDRLVTNEMWVNDTVSEENRKNLFLHSEFRWVAAFSTFFYTPAPTVCRLCLRMAAAYSLARNCPTPGTTCGSAHQKATNIYKKPNFTDTGPIRMPVQRNSPYP